MAELRWIKMSFSLILMLQFTAAVTGQLVRSSTVRVGDDVTLSCESLRDDHNDCESTMWLSTYSRVTAAVLVRRGQVVGAARAKSDTLSVSKNCSLVIKKVTEEDVGRYYCRQEGLEQQDSVVYLAVVTMTEQNHTDDEVTFTCLVTSPVRCRDTVKWLFQGQDVGKDNPELRTSPSECSASVTFNVHHFGYTARCNSFTCEVTDGYTDEVQLFAFSPQSSDEETTTESTAAGNNEHHQLQNQWRWIIVSVGLAALITSVVAVNIWIRTKEKKTQMDELTVHYDVDDDTVNYENI